MDCIWEVGKTYRTMITGITATVSHICEAGGYLIAKMNVEMGKYDAGDMLFSDGEPSPFRFSDGGVLGFRIADTKNMPHLTSDVIPVAILNCPWKVGRTYKTAIHGAVATIDWIDGATMAIHGRIDGDAVQWSWHLDGKLCGFRNHKDTYHLTTDEADPPQKIDDAAKVRGWLVGSSDRPDNDVIERYVARMMREWNGWMAKGSREAAGVCLRMAQHVLEMVAKESRTNEKV